jgi:hypothetical protein
MTRYKEGCKLGHQAPKGLRVNNCNDIHIEGDFHYCESHNFIYNSEDEEKKLYRGEPCYYTDDRFLDSWNNFYHSTYLFRNRFNPISIKSAIRKINKCKGIPKGTIIDLGKSWYYSGKRVDNTFLFKVKKENPVDFKFQLSDEGYSKNFTNCEFSRQLTDALRESGFIVRIQANTDFITGMINTASAYVGNENKIDPTLDGEVAIAYGYGKKIGFSSFNNNFMGYSNGRNSVLFDCYNYFNKWSQCLEILKTDKVEDIVKKLMQPNTNFYSDYDEEI